LDLTGTQVSVKIVESKVSSLALGSPLSVYIDRPKRLTPSGVTIQSSSNLDNIYL
jgi:hypothetical protein